MQKPLRTLVMFLLRLLISVVFGVILLYAFAALTGYVPWIPDFGHATLGVLGWIVMFLFLPIAYGLGFVIDENRPPYFEAGLAVAVLGGIAMWLFLAQRSRKQEECD